MLTADLILIGCWVYCLLAIAAALKHIRAYRSPALTGTMGISVLKPLSGMDDGLEENLRSFFEQDYPCYELLFAVRHEDDPARGVVEKLIGEYPAVPARLIVTGEPPYAHGKVYSLQCMFDQARYDLIAMSDSDVRVCREFCASMAAEFENGRLGLATCPYRAIAGKGIWSKLEAIGMNTDFHAGVFTAVMMEGATFAVGPTIVARRDVLSALGGIERVKDYLAEDFMLGRIAANLGFVVRFSSYVIEHRIGSSQMVENFTHRLRWARSSRRSRPWGYLGQFFTHPLPVGLCLAALCPGSVGFVAVALALRALTAWIVSERVLRARVPWLLLPVQDTVAFLFWIAGFFGNSIEWRGRRYTLNRDGTMELAR